MWLSVSRIMLTSTAKMAKLPFSSHRVILHRSNRLATGSSPMARVSANLLYIVIYGTQLACHLDPADGQLNPADAENGGYTKVFSTVSPPTNNFWKRQRVSNNFTFNMTLCLVLFVLLPGSEPISWIWILCLDTYPYPYPYPWSQRQDCD